VHPGGGGGGVASGTSLDGTYLLCSRSSQAAWRGAGPGEALPRRSAALQVREAEPVSAPRLCPGGLGTLPAAAAIGHQLQVAPWEREREFELDLQ
jgi:hypothetical protein